MLAARLVIVTITPDEVLTQTRERARLLTGTIGGGGRLAGNLDDDLRAVDASRLLCLWRMHTDDGADSKQMLAGNRRTEAANGMQAAAAPVPGVPVGNPLLLPPVPVLSSPKQQRRQRVTFAPGVNLLDGDSRERLHKRNRQLNQAYDQAYDSSTSGTSCAHDATDSPRKTRRSSPAPTP
jgi:hypothetical protein